MNLCHIATITLLRQYLHDVNNIKKHAQVACTIHMASDVNWALMISLDGEAIMSVWISGGLVGDFRLIWLDMGGIVIKHPSCIIMGLWMPGGTNCCNLIVHISHMWVYNQRECIFVDFKTWPAMYWFVQDSKSAHHKTMFLTFCCKMQFYNFIFRACRCSLNCWNGVWKVHFDENI